jgi:DNA repair exonuclease SbcCD ATPase subunit
MKITIKSIHIENFKGIKMLDVTFSGKMKISGQNAVGKTTIFDAFTWLLFNKNSSGEEKFNVRPLNEGIRVDNVEIKVSAILDVDGKEVELSKTQKQNWVKKRGTDTAVLQGNVNSFEIDGYPKSEADFKAYVSELAQSEEMFKMLTNPQYFSSLKWKDQRDILMKLVSEVSDVELAQTDAKYAPLLSELEKAPSTDDIRAKFSKALNEWKKKQAEIPVRIDEAMKSKVDIDVAEQELAKTDLETKIADIDAKIKDSDGVMMELGREEMQLQFDMSGIMQTMNRDLTNRRSEIEAELRDLQNEIKRFADTIALKERRVSENETVISNADSERKRLGEEYNAETAKAFDEFPYLFDESKWVFDENSTVCSLCGQKLPEDKIEQLKADFESRKRKAKSDAEEKLKSEKIRFDTEKRTVLNRLVDIGTERKNLITKLRDENAKVKEEIKSLKEQEQEDIAKKEKICQQLSSIPEIADYSQNEEYVKMKARHDEVLVEIEKMNANGENAAVESLKSEKEEIQARLYDVNKIIAKASMNVEIDERISELQTEQKEIGQKVADQEHILYLLEEFIRFKLNKVSESINSHFKTVKFKLFDMQLNGGMKDCCECTVGGVPYSSLNSGHKIVAGLDIIRSLSELYGVSAPIFVDNAESLTSEQTMRSQLILLIAKKPQYMDEHGEVHDIDDNYDPTIHKLVYDGSLKVEGV